jgi:hypothetical protein
VLDIPILDKSGAAVGIIARWQAFYNEFYETGRLRRMQYAEPIMNAARLAQNRGYGRISVAEFGVAGGTGLVLAELYARETERLTGVKINVYGFDTGAGLPALGSRDPRALFVSGEYPMDYPKLRRQLIAASLIIGDIRDTAPAFFNAYHPPPLGAMLIDVDLYSSAAPVLDMLLEDDGYFLPIVYLYFDDIFAAGEFEGEWLAVKEFNRKSENIKIAPEGYSINIDQADGVIPFWRYRSKNCYRYSHPRFNVVRPSAIGTLELNL